MYRVNERRKYETFLFKQMNDMKVTLQIVESGKTSKCNINSPSWKG